MFSSIAASGGGGESVTVHQVSSPGEISIRPTKYSSEFSAFDKLNKEFNTLFGTDTYVQVIPFDIAIGKKYVARVPTKNNEWCRVKVENIMEGARHYKVICYLIDYGQEQILDRQCLRKVDLKYFSIPAQVKSVSLANILPASLQTDIETFNTDIRQSDQWNPSATEFLKSLIVGKSDIRVEYVPGSEHRVTMYVNDLCLNDELVSNRLALPAPSPAWSRPRKVYTFEESLELDRQLQEEELKRSAVYQEEMDLPLRLSLHDVTPEAGGDCSVKPAAARPSAGVRTGTDILPAKGRGQLLLSALENTVPPGSNIKAGRGDVEPQSSIRLPHTQSIAQTCSPPRPTKPNYHTSPLANGDSYSKQAEAEAANGEIKAGESDGNTKNAEAVFSGDGSYSGQATSLAGTRFSKQTRGVSFSDTDDVKEFCRDAPLIGESTILLSSGCDSDDPSFTISRDLDEEDIRVYQKRLQNVENGAYETGLSAISYDQSRAIALKKQATVFSDLPITPIFSIQNSKLHQRALRHWRSLGGADSQPLRTVQAYGWPALRRGMELVAITDPFYMVGRDGVSLSYIMATATLLFDVESYKCLPPGSGAKFVILCASWSKAEQIYFHVSSLFGDKPERSLLVLHGRRETEHKLYCQLVNGTDVIVSTPCTFIRMLKSGHTNVERLCHLCIDDADIITKEFPTQLSEIMKEVGIAVSENVDRAAPRQIALFSSSWTPLIGLFRDQYMTSPVTVITNKIEAATACNVKQVIHYIDKEEQRLSTMLTLVSESGFPSIRLVVCTHIESDASKVYNALKAYGREVFVAMKSLQDLDQTIELWEGVRSENSYPILVITDEVLELLICEDNPVVDAQYVLHYNMPAKKKLLGMRLHCLSSNYVQVADDLMLSSHIIFSARDQQAATTLVKMLDKTGSDVPDRLRQLSIQSIQTNESGKKKELCSYMKSFGECRDQLKCMARHIVSPQLDTPVSSLPTSGDIEFKVISVKDAATCYAKLIKHRDVNGVLRNVDSKNFLLDLSLQSYFARSHIKISIDPATIEVDRLCVYEKDKVYYRAKILHVLEDPSTQYPPAAGILLLDEGRLVRARTVDLYELPEDSSLEVFPLEIVEIRICKLKPVDHDIDWSSEANAYMSRLMHGETLSGKIQLCLGNTLWCDPVVKRRCLQSGVWASLWYARHKLYGDVNTGHLAATNADHLELLRAACAGKVELPAITKSPRAPRGNELVPVSVVTEDDADVIPISNRQLDEGDATHVYISEVDGLDLFFLIRVDQHQRLLKMEEELQEVMKKKGKQPLKSIAMRSLCIAQYDDKSAGWCRCSIMSETAGKLQLLAVDYGLLLEKPRAEVSGCPPAPEDLRVLPCQAIECHMATVMPIGGEWTATAGDVVWDHCEAAYSLFAKVISRKSAKCIGDTSYGVELIDTATEEGVYISHLLISKGLAQERKLNIPEQLGIECDTDQLDYPFQQIPKLIRLLNRTEAHERRLLVVQYIHQLVQQSSNLKHEMRRNGIVKGLCSLVNTVNLHEDLLYHIMDCFIILTLNNMDNCEELWWEKGFSYLHEQLEICDDNGLLSKVLNCLKQLLRSDSVRKEVDNLESFTSNLVHIARTSTIALNRVLSMDILNLYIQTDDKRVAVLVKQDIVNVLTDILSVSNDEMVEASAQLIATLVSANGKQPATGPWTNTLAVLSTCMFKVKTDSGLLSCAKTLDILLKNLNGAANLLKSTQLHEKIQRLVNSGLGAQTREFCINVLIKVKPDAPPSQPNPEPARPTRRAAAKPVQKMHIQPINLDSSPRSKEMRVPAVQWWECSKFFMIQVQVHDALTLDPPPSLTYTANTGKLHFRCGEYQFKLGPLYAKIVSTRSRREVWDSEIKYALYKEKPELWTKLMRAGHKKPSYVQPNMDLMITSSDDETDIYDKDPFRIKPEPTLKYDVFGSIRGQPRSLSERPPPVDEFLSSDGDEESNEEDERFDDDLYRKRYDVFNI